MEQKRDYLIEEECNSLTMSESFDFSQVEQIDVTIINSWDNIMNGQSRTYTPESKAYFDMRCQFAECYGPLTGFHFTDKVRETVRQKLTSTIFKVHCGGYGDHGHQYHCDNWIEVKLIVKYQKDCQYLQ